MTVTTSPLDLGRVRAGTPIAGSTRTCAALLGERCRFSLLARPSMEAVGIDVYHMVAAAGWDIYPIGSSAKPDEIPKGTLAGIVIVQ